MANGSEKKAMKLPSSVLRQVRSEVAKGARQGMLSAVRGQEFRKIIKKQLRQAAGDVVKAVAPGAAAGAVTGGTAAGLTDRNIGTSALTGALLGGVAGGMGVRMLKAGPVGSAALGGLAGAPAGLFGKKKTSQETPVKNKYAGVTLDWYDDRGATLKAKFQTVEELPDVIKEADVRPKEKLAHEDFALVAVDEGNVMCKYACHDPGTTAMSVIYFMEHGDKLPEDAQKLAAANLVKACEQFELAPPGALEKIALRPSIGGLEDRLGVYLTDPQEEVARGLAEKAEQGSFVLRHPWLTGIPTLGIAPAWAYESAMDKVRRKMIRSDPGLRQSVLDTAEARRVQDLEQQKVDVERDKANQLRNTATALSGAYLAGKSMDQREREREKVSSALDITGKQATPKVKVAKPVSDDDYAVVMPDGSRHYPINSWDLIKKAEVYYSEEGLRMAPDIRRQFAVKLASKATVVGYPLDADIFEAGSTGFAHPGHLKAAVEMRKIACAPGGSREFLDELFEKRASIGPAVYSECLRRFDIEVGLDQGWDRVVLDPWASTFGIHKTAEVVWEQGADRVTSEQLTNLACNHTDKVNGVYSGDFASEFKRDPVGIFMSMPDPQKKALSRMAADSSSQGGAEYAAGGADK